MAVGDRVLLAAGDDGMGGVGLDEVLHAPTHEGKCTQGLIAEAAEHTRALPSSKVAIAAADGRGVGAGSIEHASADRCKGGVRRIGVVRANLVAESATHSSVVEIGRASCRERV